MEKAPAPQPEKSASVGKESEVNPEYVKRLGEDLLYNYSDEQPELMSRDVRNKMKESPDVQQREEALKFQKNKYRKNFFTVLRGFLYYVLDENMLPVKNREEVERMKNELYDIVDTISFGAGEPTPPEAVRKATELLQTILH
ncbi:MAG: hypothetical protein KGI60_03080 [Patescibacteria group bacterium]|nr:hypothetical protein [Patescibacteria group bacterium]